MRPLASQGPRAELIGTTTLPVRRDRLGHHGRGRLAGGNVAIAAFANTLATVFALFVLIEDRAGQRGVFQPTGHGGGGRSRRAAADGTVRTVAVYVACQLAGAALGAWLAHAMFELPWWQISASCERVPANGWQKL